MEDTNTEPNKKRKADEITEDGDAQDAGKANAKTDGGDAVSNNVKEERQEQDDGADNDAKDDTPAVDKADAPVETAEDSKKPADTAEKEKNDVAPARKPNNYDKLKYVVVTNDGRDESLIKLVGLKSLFAKQLPKMPRAYIARLVFDRNHVSLAILNEDPSVKDSDEEIIGAICYRPFKDMRFAEIAFCAVNATHQVKVS